MPAICEYPGCTTTTDIYTPFPTCVSCQSATCPEHQIPGTLTDADLDQPPVCYCHDCAEFMPGAPASRATVLSIERGAVNQLGALLLGFVVAALATLTGQAAWGAYVAYVAAKAGR